MTWVFVGLGNPGNEYEETRHNTGRMALEHFVHAHKLPEWKEDKKIKALVTRGTISGVSVICVAPQTYMNKSGSALVHYVKSVKAAEKCVVLYDELDMGLGKAKMSFNRGSGGHKGVESIARALKTKAFWRVRIGISPTTASEKLRKPKGEQEVLDFILKKFKPSEHGELKVVFKKTSDALGTILSEGPMKAMNEFNTA